MAKNRHTEYMQLAIRLAKRGLYTTDPNPRVGCVIVKDDVVIGRGWHRRYGEAHAEILALKDAGREAEGATVYVTLEPCDHTGKTPPCTHALIAAGVREVIFAMQDPNPLVAGKGRSTLEAAGIDVIAGILENQARALNPGFIKRMESGLPYVRVKLAMSLDGRTAMASGESKWITGEAARRDVQKLRARASAILTGINTVLQDDPSLNVRLTSDELGFEGRVNQPLRVVLDSGSQFPADAQMLSCDGKTLVYVTENRKDLHNCTFKKMERSPDGIELNNILRDLAKQEINEVHVEAGSILCGALLKEKLVDEIVIYMAPTIMGNNAKGLFAIPDIVSMNDKINLSINDIRKIGKDYRLTISPVYA